MANKETTSVNDFNEALKVGRPPNIVRLFPNSRALIVSGKVIDRVKCGLSVDIGVRAFLPGSLAKHTDNASLMCIIINTHPSVPAAFPWFSKPRQVPPVE